MSKIIIENAHVVTNDRSHSEYAGGHLVIGQHDHLRRGRERAR